MSATELLPKWSPEANGGAVMLPSRSSKTISVRLPSFSRLTVKDSTAWHSRISNLIFFILLLGIGAILGVVTTLNAVQQKPEVIWLSSMETISTTMDASFEELPNSSNDLQSMLALMPYPVDLSSLSDVYHDMSDAELLWRASVTDGIMRRDPRPESFTPKVAYLFLTRGPLPLAPLWERYFEGHEDLYSIYIHAHPNYLPNVRPDSVFFRRNIPSKEVSWAKLSMFAAERRLLANALLDAANERFVLVSESCIPITPFPVAYQYFLESEHSFVEAFEDLGQAGIGRYHRIRGRQKLNPEISAEQWRKGSQWFEMSRELALMVVADSKYYPKFETVLCMGDCWCYVDEHYLSTVLTILAPSRLANRTTTFVEFQNVTDAHPFQWEPSDITELTLKNVTTGYNCTYNGNLTETCHLFARKFSPETIVPLLELATSSFGIP